MLSKVPYGDKKCLLSSVSSLVNDLPDGKAQLIYSDIPNSGLILRTEAECKTIWELSSRSQSTRDLDYFCKKLLSLVNEDRTKVQSAEQEIAKAFAIGAPLANPPSSPGPLPSDDVQDETLKAAQAGIETNPPTQDKPDDKQRRITHGFEREIERLLGTGVVPKASRRKK